MKLMKLGSKKRDARSFSDGPGSSRDAFPTSFRSPVRFTAVPKSTESPLAVNSKIQSSLLSSSAAPTSSLSPPEKEVSKTSTPQFPNPMKEIEEENDENLDFLRRLGTHKRRGRASMPTLKPGSFPNPPREVTIDPNTVPPSPMRDPNMSDPRSREPRKPLTDLMNSTSNTSVPELGDPLGDIGMKTQLWDAQRLVRVILEKPQSDQPLDSGSILKAIRSYALMKAELVQLRRQQESQDPPTIMPLPSPSTCSTSVCCFETVAKRPDTSLPFTGKTQSTEIHRKAIIEAAKKIRSLEQSLNIAMEIEDRAKEDHSETKSLLEQAKKENDELRQQIRSRDQRFSRYREQTNKAIEQKDFRISKFERSNARLQEDISKALGSLSEMVQALRSSDCPEFVDVFQVEHKSILSILKRALAMLPTPIKKNDLEAEKIAEALGRLSREEAVDAA